MQVVGVRQREDSGEVEVIRELMTAAAKGADRLPTDSSWRAACVEVQRECAAALRRRGGPLRLLS